MRRTIAVTLALAGLAAIASPAGLAAAQDAGARNHPVEVSAQRRVRVRPRIVVTPAARIHRQCVDIYVVEHRLTGDTVVPNMRCWWAYR